jgi:hypothetical protein
MVGEASITIRDYRPGDREAVRRICCETGFLGRPIDPVFEDREMFADFLTMYYTDVEPGTQMVVEDQDGRVAGYVLAGLDPKAYASWKFRTFPRLALRLLARYFTRYGAESKRYVRWLVFRGRKETPREPDGPMPHMHINLLPHCKQVQSARLILDTFFEKLHRLGAKGVYGQMVTFESRRGERMFARYGLEVLDSREVTKYRHLTDRKIFLFTVVKNLEHNVKVYGLDLARQEHREKA